MSTFFYDILDFMFTTKFAIFFMIPIPFYALTLFYRAFCYTGGKYND